MHLLGASTGYTRYRLIRVIGIKIPCQIVFVSGIRIPRCRPTNMGEFVPVTSYDVITRADVDLEPEANPRTSSTLFF